MSLAWIIVGYWHDRGFTNVNAQIFKLDVTNDRNEWGVRSNLKAGLPPKGKSVAERRREFLGT